nr:MAG TPA: hypothetical protein [Inoviridae sp.]
MNVQLSFGPFSFSIFQVFIAFLVLDIVLCFVAKMIN